MEREERDKLREEGNEENFKMLAAAVIREALTEYVMSVRAGKRTNAICRYIMSEDFRFFCDMVDIGREDLLNSEYMRNRIMIK